MHVGRIVLDLVLTLVLLGVSIFMTLCVYGDGICKNKKSKSETRLVLKRPLIVSEVYSLFESVEFQYYI